MCFATLAYIYDFRQVAGAIGVMAGTSRTYGEESAKTIYGALPGYTRLLRGLLGQLKGAERRRTREEA